MNEVYLARLIWDTSEATPFWRAPDNTRLLIDLRSLPQCANPGTQFPMRAIVQATGPVPTSVGIRLANDVRDIVPGLVKQGLRTALNLGENIVANQFDLVLMEVLNRFADPAGQTSWKPQRGSRRTGVRLGLGEWILREAFGETHPAWQNTIEVFRADYRRNKADGVPLPVLRKWTGAEMMKLWGRLSDELVGQLLPPEHVSDGYALPASIFGDTFVEATTDTALASHTPTGPNAGTSWSTFSGGATTVIAATDKARNTSSQNYARMNNDLASDAHKTTAGVSSSGAGRGSVCTRWTSSNVDPAQFTYYYGGHVNGGTNTYRFGKFVDLVHTVLSAVNATAPGTGEITDILESSDGDLHTFTSGGVARITNFSDTSITGNLRGGIFGHNVAANDVNWDDFVMEDLAAGAARRVMMVS